MAGGRVALKIVFYPSAGIAEGIKLGNGLHIPQHHGFVVTHRGQPAPVGMKGNAAYSGIVALEGDQQIALQIPEFNGFINAGGG